MPLIRTKHWSILCLIVGTVSACGGGGGSSPIVSPQDSPISPPSVPPPTEPPIQLPSAAVDWQRDILTTALEVNVDTQQATARIQLAASESEAASFEIGDLAILAVESAAKGKQLALNYAVAGSALHIGIPASPASPAPDSTATAASRKKTPWSTPSRRTAETSRSASPPWASASSTSTPRA